MSTDELNRRPEVREILAEVIATHADQIGTHYEGCYRRHAGCLAVLLRDMLEQKPATTAGPFGAVLAAQKSGKTNAMLEQLIAAAAGRNIEARCVRRSARPNSRSSSWGAPHRRQLAQFCDT